MTSSLREQRMKSTIRVKMHIYKQYFPSTRQFIGVMNRCLDSTTKFIKNNCIVLSYK